MAYKHVHQKGWRLLAVLGVMALTGCSHSVKIEPQMEPKDQHQFVNIVYVEGTHSADIPKELTDTMNKEMNTAMAAGNQFSKPGIEERKRRGDKKLETMTIEWKVLKFEPGNYWLRRFVPFYFGGKGSIELEATYMNSSKKVLGKIKMISRVDPKPSDWLTYQGVGAAQWGPLANYFFENYYKKYE